MRALPPLLFVLSAAVGPFCAPFASAQDVGKRLHEIEQQIQKGKQKSEALEEKAKSLTEDLSEKNRARVEMAKSIHELEERMLDLEAEVATLDTSEQAKREALVEGRRTYGQLLVALERMSRLPPQAVVAYPAEPGELVRAAAVLRGVVPRIEGRAAALKAELESLTETRARIAEKRAELARIAPQLRRQRAELDKQVAALSTQQRTVLADRQVETQRLEKLSREAEGLRELFDKLEIERAERAEEEKARGKTTANQPAGQKAAPTKLNPRSAVASAAPFAVRKMTEARGDLLMPAVGRITGQYGEALQPGISRKGLAIETRPGAQVVAPYDGKVVFAGPFRAYGLLLIIEHSEGYHTLLAGMSRIDAETGQWLLSGEPVGIMGQSTGQQASDAPPSLYVELRRNGQPINPLPWLAARKGKANG